MPLLYHEKSLDNVLAAEFQLKKTRSKDGQQRLDFFCLGDGRYVAHVVEIKRPGDQVGKQQLDKLNNYVYFLRNKLIEGPLDPEWRQKIERNRTRDRQATRLLRKQGWSVLRIWECHLTKKPGQCVSRIRKAIKAAPKIPDE